MRWISVITQWIMHDQAQWEWKCFHHNVRRWRKQKPKFVAVGHGMCKCLVCIFQHMNYVERFMGSIFLASLLYGTHQVSVLRNVCYLIPVHFLFIILFKLLFQVWNIYLILISCWWHLVVIHQCWTKALNELVWFSSESVTVQSWGASLINIQSWKQTLGFFGSRLIVKTIKM